MQWLKKVVTRNRSPNISVKIYCFELINLTAGESGVADSSLKWLLSPHDKNILSIVHSNNASLQRVGSLVIFQIINDLSQTAESFTEASDSLDTFDRIWGSRWMVTSCDIYKDPQHRRPVTRSTRLIVLLSWLKLLLDWHWCQWRLLYMRGQMKRAAK